MKLETLADWNSILSGCECCPMPECPLPTMECESITAEIGSEGHFDPDEDTEWKLYQKYTLTTTISYSVGEGDNGYNGSGSGFETTGSEFFANFSGYVSPPGGDCKTWAAEETDVCDTAATESWTFKDAGVVQFENSTSRAKVPNTCDWTDTQTETDRTVDPVVVTVTDLGKTNVTTTYVNPGTGGNTVNFRHLYESGKTYPEWLVETVRLVSSEMVFEEGCVGDGCESSTMATAPAGLDDPAAVSITKARFRWEIPTEWEGSYFKITWDLVTYPTDINAEKSYVQDLTWEWTGPGDPEDPASWQSPWFEIEPPGDPGTRKVVNIRYECYRSTKLGQRPQTTGDGEDITGDVPLQNRFTSNRHSINLLRL